MLKALKVHILINISPPSETVGFLHQEHCMVLMQGLSNIVVLNDNASDLTLWVVVTGFLQGAQGHIAVSTVILNCDSNAGQSEGDERRWSSHLPCTNIGIHPCEVLIVFCLVNYFVFKFDLWNGTPLLFPCLFGVRDEGLRACIS